MTEPLLPHPPGYFVARLVDLGARLREAILGRRDAAEAAGAGSIAQESAIARDGVPGSDYTGDTIYAIDERGETALLSFCEQWARELDRPFVLIAEGLPGQGRRTFPNGAAEPDATFECIVDPIDGTRGLMYEKRSAWTLAAVAPGQALLGRHPNLADIAVAVQSELPTRRARLADTLWATRAAGAGGETLDLATGARRPFHPAPSRATTLAHGFATVAKFFPGTKEAAARLEERLFAEVVGEHASGAPLVFDDEYISSGGQLYELLAGHDRFIADLRPVFAAAQETKDPSSFPKRLCARPYDLCTALIAEESGVIVTDEWGQPLSAPLDTEADVAWAGYANSTLRAQIEPVLQRLLRELGVPAPRLSAGVPPS